MNFTKLHRGKTRMARKETHGRAWLKAYLYQGTPTFLNASASAKAAGYRAKTDDSFRAIGYQNRKKFEPTIAKWLDDNGFSEARLKTKVLELMDAKETVFQKLKGAVLQSSLPDRHRVVATSGTIIQTKDGDVYGNGDTLLEIDVQNYAVQVKSLDMALKIKGVYAPEKHEHSGEVGTRLQLTDEDRKLGQQIVQAAMAKMLEAKRAKPA
jgi:hypothetical protein